MGCEGEMLFLRPKNSGTRTTEHLITITTLITINEESILNQNELYTLEQHSPVNAIIIIVISSLILFILSFSASCDAFFLAPEFQEHGIVTEKVCRFLVTQCGLFE